jgi:hypothetical protein
MRHLELNHTDAYPALAVHFALLGKLSSSRYCLLQI